MAIGIGGSTEEVELACLRDMTAGVQPIDQDEFYARINRAQSLMKEKGLAAVYLNAGTNLYYFTGTRWYASERMVGAILPANGDLIYIAPDFELGTLEGYMLVKGPTRGWQEHESPYQLFGEILSEMGIKSGSVGIDESSSFFLFDGLRQSNPQFEYVDAKPITAGCRMVKSNAELALLQRANDMTYQVHKSVARILRPGITTKEVESFIDRAHRAVGAMGSFFCIVLFGEDTAYPHGVKSPKALELNDMVLIDTGCQLDGYHSDITRTYVFGEANDRQRQIWDLEKAAQTAAFNAAGLGVPCAEVDNAARAELERNGLGPEYQLPGLPHRTGHGIGLDIHEWPYLVRGNGMPLAVGMCFSNEPMICIPGEFGVRHEDHFYMTEQGPKWFTEPSHSIDNPFREGA